MTLRQVHWLYLVVVIAVPAAVVGWVTRSGWITGGAFVVLLVLSAGPADVVFRWMLRWLGDRSEEEVKNTAVRFGLGVLAKGDIGAPLRRVYPHLGAEEIDRLVALHRAVNERLASLVPAVDERRQTEAAARDALRAEFPFLDEGNLDWLNARGRAYVRRVLRQRPP